MSHWKRAQRNPRRSSKPSRKTQVDIKQSLMKKKIVPKFLLIPIKKVLGNPNQVGNVTGWEVFQIQIAEGEHFEVLTF